MRIVFLGTPEFGATILNELIKEHEIVLVVTQPDSVKGRKKEIVFSPVKKVAIDNNIPIFQPHKIREEYEYILKYDFDIIVSAAFGQIVGTRLLNYPKYKAINVHGSILPKYRGGAPIQRSIINGDVETGISIMYMAKGMDTGDILKQEKLKISPLDNSDSLFIKMANLGAKMINPFLKELEEGKINPIKQNENQVTYAYNLTKEDEVVNFNKNAFDVYNQIRGLSTNPGAYFTIDSIVFKVYDSEIDEDNKGLEPGTICKVTKDYFSVSCIDKAISFYRIKPEGKGLMNVKDYLNGKGKNIIYYGRRII